MKNKSLVTILILAVGVILVGVYYSKNVAANKNYEPTADKSGDTMINKDNTMMHNLPTYTLEEVTNHNSANDCWMVLHNKVYDMTNFVSRHPGGSSILQGCGTDATTLYETRPMGSRTPHSDMARDIAENYLIGTLSQ